MNYKESKKVLEEVIKAKRIILNCHRRPDPDSVSSALAMYSVLRKIGKKVVVICPDPAPIYLNYLENFKIIKQVDFNNYDFNLYDLFIVLDSGDWNVISGIENTNPPKNLKIIKIDHHDSQEKIEKISIVDPLSSSTSEILYFLFKDWNIKLGKTTATCLLSGIIADSVCFSIPLTSYKTLDAASHLMKIGADKNLIMDKQFYSLDLDLLKFFGEVLRRLRYDKKYNFAWSAVPYKVYLKYGGTIYFKNASANMFFSKIVNSLFGVLMVEEKPGFLGVSFRSARRFDTSRIASALGGGGHHDSSAVAIEDIPFKLAVNKVLDTAREYAEEKK